MPIRYVHDVPHGSYRIDIGLIPYKLRCGQCKQRFTPSIKGIIDSSQMTERLRKYSHDECLIQPYTTSAARCGISDEPVRQIAEEVIDEMDAERISHPIQAPRVLGIDEKHIQHKMRGILVDGESHALLDMFEDNSKETMQAGISRLKGYATKIKVVTTDMANAYLEWLPGFLPNATIVIDKYHVGEASPPKSPIIDGASPVQSIAFTELLLTDCHRL